MADNTKPAGNLPDWANDRAGGNNTAPNPALGAADITEPGVARKDVGWQSGDIPPRNWWNWMIHKAGAWLRWAAANIAESFLGGHFDDLALDFSGLPLTGYHGEIKQISNYNAGLAYNRYLMRSERSDASIDVIQTREYRDEDGLTPAKWITVNARWDLGTTRWVKDDAASAASAVKLTPTAVLMYAVTAATNNWTDLQWQTVHDFSQNTGAAIAGANGISSPRTLRTIYDAAKAGTGDILMPSGLAAGATSGFLLLPNMTDSTTPAAQPDQEAAGQDNMALVTDLDRLIWFFRDPDAAAWIQRPIDPVRAHYESTGAGLAVGASTFIPIDYDNKLFDDPLADRMFGSTYACDQIVLAANKFIILGVDVTAAFPAGSTFAHSGSAAGNDDWYTVASATFAAGNTEVVSNEAPTANEGPAGTGDIVNRRFIADRDMILDVAASIGTASAGGNVTGDLALAVNPANGDAIAAADRLLDWENNLLSDQPLSGSAVVPLTSGDELFAFLNNRDAANALNYGAAVISANNNYISIHEV